VHPGGENIGAILLDGKIKAIPDQCRHKFLAVTDRRLSYLVAILSYDARDLNAIVSQIFQVWS
jgi:hypothetical protein